MTNEEFAELCCKYSHSQRVLEVKSCRTIGTNAFECIQHLTHLCNLDLSETRMISGNIVKTVMDHRPDLRAIGLVNLKDVGDKHLHYLATSCRQHAMVKIASDKLTDKHAPQLKALYIFSPAAGITAKTLQFLVTDYGQELLHFWYRCTMFSDEKCSQLLMQLRRVRPWLTLRTTYDSNDLDFKVLLG